MVGSRKPSAEIGFTLVEVLIALAITGMVVSVLMSSVFYGAKVQNGIRQESIDRERHLRVKAWFAEVLSTCLPADAASGSAFEGSEQQIICDTLMPLEGSKVSGLHRVKIALKVGADRTMQLIYAPLTSQSEPLILAELPYRGGHFSYYGRNGKVGTKWPLQFNDPETLPSRIELSLTDGDILAPATVWIVSLQATPWLEPQPRLPMGRNIFQ